MIPNNTTTFTEKYFFSEIVRLRQEWGQKGFWERTDEQRQAMIDGLAFLYLNIVNDDGSPPNQAQIEQWGNVFNSTLAEYARRETMMMFRTRNRMVLTGNKSGA